MNQIQTIKFKLENLIKEWHLGSSAEAKYRCEAYKELLEYINSLQEEPVSNDLEDYAKKESESFAEREYEIDYIDRNALAKGYYWGVKAGAQWQAFHSLETIKGMEEQAFLAGVEAEQINKSFSKEELLNGWRNKL